MEIENTQLTFKKMMIAPCYCVVIIACLSPASCPQSSSLTIAHMIADDENDEEHTADFDGNIDHLTLKVLVATIDAQWEGMGDVRSARYEPALLPSCPTIRV